MSYSYIHQVLLKLVDERLQVLVAVIPSYSPQMALPTVCGRVYGYQKGTTQAIFNDELGLESTYVDGMSLTYGSSPVNIFGHLWPPSKTMDKVHGSVPAKLTPILAMLLALLVTTTSVRVAVILERILLHMSFSLMIHFGMVNNALTKNHPVARYQACHGSLGHLKLALVKILS